MPERRRYNRFGSKYIATQGVLALLGIGSMCLALRATGVWIKQSNASGPAPPSLVFGTMGFAACLVAVIVLSIVLPRRFRCPNCNTRVPKAKFVSEGESMGDILIFVCDNCQIEWNTGLRRARDDSADPGGSNGDPF